MRQICEATWFSELMLMGLIMLLQALLAFQENTQLICLCQHEQCIMTTGEATRCVTLREASRAYGTPSTTMVRSFSDLSSHDRLFYSNLIVSGSIISTPKVLSHRTYGPRIPAREARSLAIKSQIVGFEACDFRILPLIRLRSAEHVVTPISLLQDVRPLAGGHNSNQRGTGMTSWCHRRLA